ncbi:MAG: chemotaxis protein MotA [Alphaproteobacteria bacterium]
MDIATLLGLLLGFGFVAGGIGSNMPSFIDAPSILIVIGGTFSITTVCFSLSDIIAAQGVMLKTVLFKIPASDDEAKNMIELAQKARANGILAIQGDIDQIPNDFLKQAFGLAVDGTNPEVIEMIMKSDTAGMQERHMSGALVLKKSAEIAPAMGLVGTLIGLVIMLGSLDDPSSIGPAMAIALLTTMYGAVLANMVFNPLASKLELNSRNESQLRKIYTASVLSVVRQENPRQLELVLNTILKPSKRINMFD